MVEFRLDIPQPTDPDMLQPLDFVQKCLNRAPVTGQELNEAQSKCEMLRFRHPGDSAVLHLSGAVAYIGSNLEAAKRFWAEAVLARPGYEYSLAPLREIIAGDGVWGDADAYISAIGTGIDHVAEVYLKDARAAFSDARYGAADAMAQRASALKRPTVSGLDDYDTCLAAARRSPRGGELDAWCARVFDKYQAYWLGHDHDLAEDRMDQDQPRDRYQLAELAAAAVAQSGADEINLLELGSFTGINLKLVRDALDTPSRGRCRLYGLEPNAKAVAAGNAALEGVQLLHGSHEGLAAQHPELPGHFDVCIVSRVFMILKPDMVRAILSTLRGRVSTLIICDDIYNVDGDIPVVRTPPDFCIMHAFRQLLTATGFQITDVIMAEVPDRECTGFIIAH